MQNRKTFINFVGESDKHHLNVINILYILFKFIIANPINNIFSKRKILNIYN